MFDIFKRPVVVIIVALAIIIAMVWSYVNKSISQKEAAKQTETTTTFADLSTVDPKDFDEIVKNQVATAVSKASAADSSYKIAAIEATLPSLDMKSGEMRYIFASPTDTKNNWTISFSLVSDNFIRAIIPKDDYIGNVQIMDTSLWKFNYVTAIQIAERNGGLQWRQNNGLGGINVFLRHAGKNNWLMWRVTYSSGDSTFVKEIDANSGKIVEE